MSAHQNSPFIFCSKRIAACIFSSLLTLRESVPTHLPLNEPSSVPAIPATLAPQIPPHKPGPAATVAVAPSSAGTAIPSHTPASTRAPVRFGPYENQTPLPLQLTREHSTACDARTSNALASACSIPPTQCPPSP